MSHRTRCISMLTLAVLAAGASADTLTWSGLGDGTSFVDAGNWDPAGATIDLAALVDDFVIDDPNACVGCPGGVAQISWVAGEGSLTMSAGEMAGGAGIRFTTVDLSGGVMTRMFALECDITVSNDATLVLTGAGAPVNTTTVRMVGPDARVRFTNETPDEFRVEHASKFTYDGLPGIEGVTMEVVAEGDTGCVVRSLGGNFKAQTLVWNGTGGDGTSFTDPSNWDGTPTGGIIDANVLVDHYVLNDGVVGADQDGDGVGFGVRQLYFYADGDFTMTGGELMQELTNGTQGITGGRVFVSGGVLNRQFLSACEAFISGTAEVVLNGGADPVPFGAIVDLSGEQCSVTFLNETADDFRLEHVSKFRVDGALAVEGVNLVVQPFGKTGCVVTAIGAACPADLDGDDKVGGSDVGVMLSLWGGPGSGDLDGDGIVAGGDFGLLLSAWGDCPVNPCEGAKCDDGNECTIDYCDPVTGECVNELIDGCTPDFCDGVDCNDGDPCTIDSCDPLTGECINEFVEGCGEGGCGDPLAGACNQANGTPACSDAACCAGVCAIDSFCCEVEWDAACVNIASGVGDC